MKINILDRYGDERKSEIIPISGDLTIEDMIADEDMVLTISHNGYIKRLPVATWKTQNRGGKGVITIKTTDKVGNLIAIMEAVDTDDLMLITNQGIMIRQPVDNIRTIGRNTQGVRIIKLSGDEKVVSAIKIDDNLN